MEAIAGSLVGQYLEVLEQDSFLGFGTVRLVFAYRFPLFFHESALTNPLACISLKVLTAE